MNKSDYEFVACVKLSLELMDKRTKHYKDTKRFIDIIENLYGSTIDIRKRDTLDEVVKQVAKNVQNRREMNYTYKKRNTWATAPRNSDPEEVVKASKVGRFYEREDAKKKLADSLSKYHPPKSEVIKAEWILEALEKDRK